MLEVKRVVCLANSRKLSGRCIAGKEIADRRVADWIRPVSSRPSEEVSEHERQYEDGSDPRVLDVVDIPLLGHRPKSFQQENWLLDPERYWVKVGRVQWDRLERLVDPVLPLWENGHHTGTGRNDRIPTAIAGTLQSSLRFLHVDRLAFSVFAPGERFGNAKRRVQGRFRHDGADYRLWVTDPRYEREYLAQPNGDYEVGECFLTVSIGEPFEEFCYKLIAAIIRPEDQA